MKLIFSWLNFAAILFSSFLFLLFYVRSVSPAGLAWIIGLKAYPRCGTYRTIAICFEMFILVGYILVPYFPLPVPLSPEFPWSRFFSIIIALLIGVPSLILMLVGMKDAGEEAIRPKVEHEMYAGIYEKIRHPQAVGEVFLFWVAAFLLHSPFLTLFSFIYLPVFIIMCWAEEQDLLLRFGDSYAEYCQRTGAFFPKSLKKN